MHSSQNGPYKTLLKRGEFIDETRDDRPVPFKIYHPADLSDPKSSPVILWSHGFGGNRDGAAFISRFLSSHGYTLVHITHRGTDSSLWEGQPGHPWDILRKAEISRETTLNRFKDVPFVLDQLPKWAAENPDIGPFMDLSRIGMSGHSFGAMTTQVIAGQKFPDESGDLMSMRDPRITCGILYSPVPIGHLTDAAPEELYGAIDIPLLHMSGTEDDSPLHDFGFEMRLLVHDHSGHDEKHLHILEGGDHMIYNGTRGKLAENPLREEHEQQIQATALTFWDAYLKDDKGAKERLHALKRA